MAVFRIDRFAPTGATTSAARERFAGLMKRAGAVRRKPAADLIRIVETGLVLGIGALIALTLWMGLGPIDPPPPPPARAAPVEQAAVPANPFRTAEVAEAAPADPAATFAETTLDLKLHGTWIDNDGGVAFIGTPDGEQSRFATGDTITNGVTLDRVFRDRVVIVRNGVRESLSLINREDGSGSVAEYAQAPPAQGDADFAGMAMIGDVIIASPETDEVGNVQLILQPADDGGAFESLGLQPGDALVAVDNQAIGTDMAEGLQTIAAVEDASSVTLSIERDGVVMPITVDLSQPSEIPNEQE